LEGLRKFFLFFFERIEDGRKRKRKKEKEGKGKKKKKKKKKKEKRKKKKEKKLLKGLGCRVARSQAVLAKKYKKELLAQKYNTFLGVNKGEGKMWVFPKETGR
jgi:hypothetical protein